MGLRGRLGRQRRSRPQDVRGTPLGVMATQISATLAPGNDALDGSFTSNAARPDGRVLSRGSGSAARQPDRAAAMNERARAQARRP